MRLLISLVFYSVCFLHFGQSTVLYSNDFSNPAEWTLSNTSVPAVDWQLTTNTSIVPFSFFQPAGFTTASNGFGFIDSDAQGESATQDCILQLNTLITSCANQPYVVLRFSQMFRGFYDTTSVEVSNNGTTWTEFLCNTDSENNVNSGNPEKVLLDISTVAGNQDTVYLRFRYRASDAWFWAVDDLEIMEQYQLDMVGKNTTFGSIGNWGIEMPYYQIPVEQIAPIALHGRVHNAGYGLQTDVMLTAVSNDGYVSTSPIEVVNPGLTLTQDLDDLYTPTSAVGTKTVTTVVSSFGVDQAPENDTLSPISIGINTKYYARSTDVRTGRVTNNFYLYGFETGNIFDIFSDATISSALVHVNDETTPGTPLFVRLYEAISDGVFNLLCESDTLVVPSLSVDSVFRVRLQVPTQLLAGSSYLLTAGSTGASVPPGLVIGTSNKAELFTSYFKPEDEIDWYSFTETPMVKMNFESALGIEKVQSAAHELNIYPNPTTGKLTITISESFFDAQQPLELLSQEGKRLHTLTYLYTGNSIEVDLSTLPSGSYFIRARVGEQYFTERVILLR